MRSMSGSLQQVGLKASTPQWQGGTPRAAAARRRCCCRCPGAAAAHPQQPARQAEAPAPLAAPPPAQRTPRAARRMLARSSGGGGGASGAPPPRLQAVLDEIDAANSQDPRKTIWQGRELPYELAYSQWLTDWALKLAPAPSEELRIVARGQHIKRWASPRSSYPEGRAGYLKWRADLKRMHADTVGDIMARHGYGEESIARAKRMINKLDLKSDPENQVVEDALCLVFLEHQFTELIEKEGADKMVDIVRKTWGKMGAAGRAAALQLPLTPAQADIVQRALSGV